MNIHVQSSTSYLLPKTRRKIRQSHKESEIDLSTYSDRPIEFLQEVLGIKFLTEEQKAIIESIVNQQTTNVQAAHGVGKCLEKNEPVLLANGIEVKASELVGIDFNLLTLDNGTTKVVQARADWNMNEFVYEIKTETGRRIVRNGFHPLYVGIKWSRNGSHPIIDDRGWTSVKEIQDFIKKPPSYEKSKFTQDNWSISDRRTHTIVCAVPKEIPVFGNKPLAEHEIKIMAYLIGDGGLTTSTPTFTQEDNAQLAEMRECVKEMGCVLISRNKYGYAITNPVGKRFKANRPISRSLFKKGDFSCDRHISTKRFMEIVGDKPCKFYNRLKAIGIVPVKFYGRSYISKSQAKLYYLFNECLNDSRKYKISGSAKGNMKKALELFDSRKNEIVVELVNLEVLEQQKEKAIREVEKEQGVVKGKSREFRLPNKVTELLKKHNLLFKHSKDKVIPDAIFQLPKKQLAIFLSRLFATDGWACVSSPHGNRKKGGAQIGFCSISLKLIEQVQRLLLRFGVIAYIEKKSKVNAYTLRISSSEVLLKFIEEIGIYGKEEAVETVRLRAIEAYKSQQSQSWRSKKSPKGTIWEKIVSVKKIDKPSQTVAIEVPGYHHYLTNFWEHNSFICSAVLIYWAFAVEGVVISTAPTYNQVNDILWKEVRRLYDTNKTKLGGSRTELTLKHKNKSGIVNVSMGKSSKNYDSNSFQGIHDKRLMLIQDEADGITDTIDEAFEACLTGSENRGVRIGNPLNGGSAFAKNCGISSLKIPVWNHPNVQYAYRVETASNGKPIHRLKPEVAAKILKPEHLRKDDPVKPQSEWDEDLPRDVIPGAVSIAWIEKVRAKYGEFSSYWMSRVEAEFPGDDVEGIIPLSWLKQARDRYDNNPDYWDEVAKQDRWRIGVDVADGGDDFHGLAAWRGPVLYKVDKHTPLGDREDTIRLAQNIVEPFVNQLGANYAIAVDRLGVGAGTLGTLKRDGYYAVGCTFGENAQDPIQFKNRKIELFWQLREGLRLGEIAIAPLGDIEDEVFEDLSKVRYKDSTDKTICCEPKEQTKKRIKRSPDAGDAVLIAGEFSYKKAIAIEVTRQENIDIKERQIEEAISEYESCDFINDISLQEVTEFLI